MNAPTAQIIAQTPAPVNGRVPVPVRVAVASTTMLADGDVVLLVRTASGAGALLFPPSLARQLFVVTNPSAERVVEKSKTRRGRKSVGPDLVAKFEQVAGLARAGATWEAAGKKIGVSGRAAYKFFHNPRARTARELHSAVTP